MQVEEEPFSIPILVGCGCASNLETRLAKAAFFLFLRECAGLVFPSDPKQCCSPSCLRAVAERWKEDTTTRKLARWGCSVHPCRYTWAHPTPCSEALLLLFPMGTSPCEHSDHDALPWRHLPQFLPAVLGNSGSFPMRQVVEVLADLLLKSP